MSEDQFKILDWIEKQDEDLINQEDDLLFKMESDILLSNNGRQ